MEKRLFYDESRFGGVVPCQLDRPVIDGLGDGEWMIGRLRCVQRRRFPWGRRRTRYALVCAGASNPPLDVVGWVLPFLADGVCVCVSQGETVIPRRIERVGALGDVSVLYDGVSRGGD